MEVFSKVVFLNERKRWRILLKSQHLSRPKWAQGYVMTQTKTDQHAVPVDEALDPEVISFRTQFDQRSTLDEIVREGARRMLRAAIDAEVDAFIGMHAERTDEAGKRLVVRNGSLPERGILTGAGVIPVTQGRVRDNDPDLAKPVTFSPSVLPSYLRKTKAIEELIPWLYLKVLSTPNPFSSPTP